MDNNSSDSGANNGNDNKLKQKRTNTSRSPSPNDNNKTQKPNTRNIADVNGGCVCCQNTELNEINLSDESSTVIVGSDYNSPPSFQCNNILQRQNCFNYDNENTNSQSSSHSCLSVAPKEYMKIPSTYFEDNSSYTSRCQLFQSPSSYVATANECCENSALHDDLNLSRLTPSSLAISSCTTVYLKKENNQHNLPDKGNKQSSMLCNHKKGSTHFCTTSSEEEKPNQSSKLHLQNKIDDIPNYIFQSCRKDFTVCNVTNYNDDNKQNSNSNNVNRRMSKAQQNAVSMPSEQNQSVNEKTTNKVQEQQQQRQHLCTSPNNEEQRASFSGAKNNTTCCCCEKEYQQQQDTIERRIHSESCVQKNSEQCDHENQQKQCVIELHHCIKCDNNKNYQNKVCEEEQYCCDHSHIITIEPCSESRLHVHCCPSGQKINKNTNDCMNTSVNSPCKYNYANSSNTYENSSNNLTKETQTLFSTDQGTNTEVDAMQAPTKKCCNEDSPRCSQSTNTEIGVIQEPSEIRKCCHCLNEIHQQMKIKCRNEENLRRSNLTNNNCDHIIRCPPVTVEEDNKAQENSSQQKNVSIENKMNDTNNVNNEPNTITENGKRDDKSVQVNFPILTEPSTSNKGPSETSEKQPDQEEVPKQNSICPCVTQTNEHNSNPQTSKGTTNTQNNNCQNNDDDSDEEYKHLNRFSYGRLSYTYLKKQFCKRHRRHTN